MGDEVASGFSIAHKPDDLVEILGLAEDLRARCEAGADRIEKLRIYQILIFMIMSSFTALSLFEFGHTIGTRQFPILTSAAFIGTGVGFVYTIWFQRIIQRMERRLAPDKRALFELVRIMRETEGALTESRHWSPLQKAKFHIQLSRFDIGEQQESNALNRIMPIPGDVLRPASEAIKRMTGL